MQRMIAKTKRMIVMMKKTRMKVRLVMNLGLRLSVRKTTCRGERGLRLRVKLVVGSGG